MIEVLNEYTSSDLLGVSKQDTPRRFARRTQNTNNWKYLGAVFQGRSLLIRFEVNGHKVNILVLNYKVILNKFLQAEKVLSVEELTYRKLRRVIDKSLLFSLSSNNIQVSCDCEDFRYRLAYVATKKKYGFEVSETRPAKVTNPKNKGRLCKHLITILNAPSRWRSRVTTSIYRYVKSRGDI